MTDPLARSPAPLGEIEADLLGDRAVLPGAVDAWNGQRPRARRRWLRRFARAERYRHRVERRIAEDPALAAAWAEFPRTEQRECLMAYGMVWPRSRSIRRLLAAVAGGSEYRRLAPPAQEQAAAIADLGRAGRDRDPDQVESALGDAFRAGLHPNMTAVILPLLEAPWHTRHEDVASALQELRSPDAVDALERVATATFEYPAYDEFDALHRKCTWALADIGGERSRAALARLAQSPDHQVARYAQERLDNWAAEQGRKLLS